MTDEGDAVRALDAGLGVRAFFTTRSGGVSRAPYDSLNLGRNTGDDPIAVARNRALLAEMAGVPIAFMSQIHGATVALVRDPADEPEADAMVTLTPGIALGVLVADCAPVLLHDPGSGAVAAVHAGRKGLAEGVVGAAVDRLREAGGRSAGILEAAIGPAICGGCYEVPEEMRDEVARAAPESWAETTWGTPSLDLKAAVEAQLRSAGVAQVRIVGGCTFESPDLFSHRRDSVTGRTAGVIVCGG
ncbi:MAG: peptidoglycan editing factor PgeF [Demequinaceae bacterium]|nr:peptidoglycan editing factor PgeF [Demequinaceae bacterium]